MMNSFYLLKKRLLGASLVLANIACSNAATLDVRSAFLSGNSADIPNSSPLSFTPVLSTPALDSGYAGKALVISSFSSEKTNESKAITAHYDLAGPGSSGAISQEHDRELAKITGGGTEAGLLELRLDSPSLMDSIGADLMSRAGASDACRCR